MTSDLTTMVDDVLEQEAKQRQVLQALLDRTAQQKGKAFAIRNEMGVSKGESGAPIRIPSFVITEKLEWVADNVRLGSEMPFMQSKIDKKGRLVVDQDVAESVKQRAPDWSRQAPIAAYLAHEKRRKFGTIVAVINPEWVDNPDHENWSDGVATCNAYDFEPLDSEGRIGMLDLKDAAVYALDGQHRVMGIRGIKAIHGDGQLAMRNREGTPKKDPILKEDFLRDFNLTIADLPAILNESISVELIPAVLKGETRERAAQRIRSVFITINAYAQKTGKSETTLLDESDGFAVVARKAGTLHPLFKEDRDGDRVNWKTSTLPKRTKWYTTLETIKDMASGYLSQVDPELAVGWQPKFKKQVPVRPDEEELEKAKDTFFVFLNHVHALPVFEGLESGDDLDEVRLFTGFDSDDPHRGRGHLLTRPIGQVILAKAVGGLVSEGLDLETIFQRLAEWDRHGGFEQHRSESVWYGITYDFHHKKMETRTNIDVGADILKYMVRGALEDERRRLLEAIINARRVGQPGEHKWRSFAGKDEGYDPSDPAKGQSLPQPIGSS